MRRAGVLVLALFLVNLPFVHQQLSARQLERSGREVTATVLDTTSVNGRNLVDYRLPSEVDPAGTRFSARVDDTTFEAAKQSDELVVLVVPGKPEVNQVLGQVPNRLFGVIALLGDAMLLVAGVLLWRRRRRWVLHEVVEVQHASVTVRAGGRTVTAEAPRAWLARIRPGQQVPGSLHLVAESEVLPGGFGAAFEQVSGTTYVVHGRVLDAKAGQVDLDLGDGTAIAVDTGVHRIRADIRDSAEVRGILCFSPS